MSRALALQHVGKTRFALLGPSWVAWLQRFSPRPRRLDVKAKGDPAASLGSPWGKCFKRDWRCVGSASKEKVKPPLIAAAETGN